MVLSAARSIPFPPTLARFGRRPPVAGKGRLPGGGTMPVKAGRLAVSPLAEQPLIVQQRQPAGVVAATGIDEDVVPGRRVVACAIIDRLESRQVIEGAAQTTIARRPGAVVNEPDHIGNADDNRTDVGLALVVGDSVVKAVQTLKAGWGL